jgi:hypothetical protein
MERHRPSGLLALGTSACLLLAATGSDTSGSWWSTRVDGARALAAVAIGSPWAWCALIVLLVTGVAVTHRLLGGPLLVLLSGLAAFVLGPDGAVFPWTGVTVTMLLTEGPRAIAEVALASVTEARGATTEALYSLGMIFGLFCSLLLVAHLRGARFASDLSLTERPGAIQMLLLPESRPAAGFTPWQRRVLRHAVLATVTTTVVVSVAFSSLWWVFRERDVVLLVTESRFGTLADPTRAALVGGWYPAAFWAVPLVGVAAGLYLAGKIRFVHGDPWQLATPVGIGVSWLAGLVAAIVILVVPSGCSSSSVASRSSRHSSPPWHAGRSHRGHGRIDRVVDGGRPVTVRSSRPVRHSSDSMMRDRSRRSSRRSGRLNARHRRRQDQEGGPPRAPAHPVRRQRRAVWRRTRPPTERRRRRRGPPSPSILRRPRWSPTPGRSSRLPHSARRPTRCSRRAAS